MGGTHLRINEPRVVHELVEGEIIVIDLASGNFYSLRDSAVVIWQLLSVGYAVDDIVAQLATAHEASPRELGRTIEAFLDQLVSDELLVPGNTIAPPLPTSLEISGAFQPPRYDKHTDMAELILLDPVHEVDSIGWPHRPEEAQDSTENP